MPRESSKCRTWERERRNRINETFAELCKLLPCYDPVSTTSKIEILRSAITLIGQLKEKIKSCLDHSCSSGTLKNVQGEELKKLQEKVQRLLIANEKLCVILRQAKISIPVGCSLAKRCTRRWTSSRTNVTPPSVPVKDEKRVPIKVVNSDKISHKVPKHRKAFRRSKGSKNGLSNLKPKSGSVIVLQSNAKGQPILVLNDTDTSNTSRRNISASTTNNALIMANGTLLSIIPAPALAPKPTVIAPQPLYILRGYQKPVYSFGGKLLPNPFTYTTTTQVNKLPIPALTSRYFAKEKDACIRKKRGTARKTTSPSEKLLTSELSDKPGIDKEVQPENTAINMDKTTASSLDIITDCVLVGKEESDNADMAGDSVILNEETGILEKTSNGNLTGENGSTSLKSTEIVKSSSSVHELTTSNKPLDTDDTIKVINLIPSSEEVVPPHLVGVDEEDEGMKNLELNDISNDIFASLQDVTPGCQNPESTSPTAAFLLAFPVVTSLTSVKVTETDGAVDHEDPGGHSSRSTPHLLQIGQIETNSLCRTTVTVSNATASSSSQTLTTPTKPYQTLPPLPNKLNTSSAALSNTNHMANVRTDAHSNGSVACSKSLSVSTTNLVTSFSHTRSTESFKNTTMPQVPNSTYTDNEQTMLSTRQIMDCLLPNSKKCQSYTPSSAPPINWMTNDTTCLGYESALYGDLPKLDLGSMPPTFSTSAVSSAYLPLLDESGYHHNHVYTTAHPAQFSWTPPQPVSVNTPKLLTSEPNTPTMPATSFMGTTLPTLVGDLGPVFGINTHASTMETSKTNPKKVYQKTHDTIVQALGTGVVSTNTATSAGNFLSVSQLVDHSKSHSTHRKSGYQQNQKIYIAPHHASNSSKNSSVAGNTATAPPSRSRTHREHHSKKSCSSTVSNTNQNAGHHSSNTSNDFQNHPFNASNKQSHSIATSYSTESLLSTASQFLDTSYVSPVQLSPPTALNNTGRIDSSLTRSSSHHRQKICQPPPPPFLPEISHTYFPDNSNHFPAVTSSHPYSFNTDFNSADFASTDFLFASTSATQTPTTLPFVTSKYNQFHFDTTPKSSTTKNTLKRPPVQAIVASNTYQSAKRTKHHQPTTPVVDSFDFHMPSNQLLGTSTTMMATSHAHPSATALFDSDPLHASTLNYVAPPPSMNSYQVKSASYYGNSTSSNSNSTCIRKQTDTFLAPPQSSGTSTCNLPANSTSGISQPINSYHSTSHNYIPTQHANNVNAYSSTGPNNNFVASSGTPSKCTSSAPPPLPSSSSSSLTNFNLSAIFPEINHQQQNNQYSSTHAATHHNANNQKSAVPTNTFSEPSRSKDHLRSTFNPSLQIPFTDKPSFPFNYMNNSSTTNTVQPYHP